VTLYRTHRICSGDSLLEGMQSGLRADCPFRRGRIIVANETISSIDRYGCTRHTGRTLELAEDTIRVEREEAGFGPSGTDIAWGQGRIARFIVQRCEVLLANRVRSATV
jgi:hypothetical protein